MNSAAECIMTHFNDIKIAFGQSDEFSFVLARDSSIYQRREAKLISNICSLFTSAFVKNWHKYFDFDLIYPPSFGIIYING
jgi:tRNA(His) guanylyltransferase